MRIVYIILGGWAIWLGASIWGFILGLLGAKGTSASLKGLAGYVLDPVAAKPTKGNFGDNFIFNLLFIFMGIGFAIHSFIWGIILGLFDKELGKALKANAGLGLSMCSNKFEA